jgi:UDP-glucose:(heptosyl)LPS alpha-1,3-glucosyltransferase
LIVGRGEVEKYERLARRLRVDRQVTFCGFVEEIRDYHHVADFLVHPTFYDPCSLAVLEALASGLPVITTRENGAAESMTPGVEGFVVRAGHAGELAAAIRLLLDPATRARMSVAARAAALRQTSEQSFRRLFELYHHIQASGQGRDSRSWQ